ASPWSPSTNGPVTAPAIWIDLKDEKDFDKYKGKLAGKIVRYGEMREVKPVDKALFSHLEDDDLRKLAEYPLAKREGDSFQQFLKRLEFREKVGKFFADEKAVAVLVPSRDGRNNGGSGGTIFDDTGSTFGWFVYRRDHASLIPSAVIAIEVIRILNALQVKPKHTIRIRLWTAEEQGEFGSYNYVKIHFGFIPRSNQPDQLKLTEFDRKPAGPVETKPDYQKLSAYFNLDNGSGRIRGIYLQENAAVAPIFAQWMEPLRDLGVTTITMRNTGGTDHEAFDATS